MKKDTTKLDRLLQRVNTQLAILTEMLGEGAAIEVTLVFKQYGAESGRVVREYTYQGPPD